MDHNIKRIPRPYGLTQLMVEFHSTNNIESFEIARSMVIQQWLIRNGTIFGKNLTPNQLAEFLQCDVQIVNNHMVKQMISSRVFDKDNREEWVDKIISQSLAWCAEDRMDIQRQLEIMIDSQGGTYRPFISSEVSKVLSLKQSATQNLGSLLNKVTQGQGNTLNIFTKETEESSKAPTLKDVLEIIQSEKNILSNQETVELFESSYDVLALPEVNARDQTGLNLEKEALNINKTELKRITDDYAGAIKTFDETHHDIRREIELGIVEDAEDPEIDYSRLRKGKSRRT